MCKVCATVASMFHSHRLDEIMTELDDLRNQTLARLIDPERVDTMRSNVIAWRKGREMTRESAAAVVRGLRAAGWQGTIDDLLIEREAPASPESLALLEERVGEVEAQLRALVAGVRELSEFLRPPGAGPRALPLPHRPSAEDP